MNDLVIVIGAYGSGKSEYAINLAKTYSKSANKVKLADMDVVNPYFRSRDVREKFAEDGIEVIAPDGQYKHADLPMLSPRIMGAVEDTDSAVILDVGGDPAGCRVLGRYVEKIKQRGYHMQLVINTKRPFTSDKQEILQMLDKLEAVSHLKIDELICNTNLMEYTDISMVEKGIEIIQEVADERSLEFEKYLILENNDIPDNLLGKKRVILNYFLNKPWEMPVFKGI
ncbi:MAG TPA: hypothetical protein DHM37_06165 [Candidatus Cloacimonas sp.]|jgi:organic radical activating enzyme|nr:hypothetical protein [Candidatus Cloacimonadota bacterium]HCX73286.1 hypothetical protein [Candidatus Cloacimonas sp.]